MLAIINPVTAIDKLINWAIIIAILALIYYFAWKRPKDNRRRHQGGQNHEPGLIRTFFALLTTDDGKPAPAGFQQHTARTGGSAGKGTGAAENPATVDTEPDEDSERASGDRKAASQRRAEIEDEIRDLERQITDLDTDLRSVRSEIRDKERELDDLDRDYDDAEGDYREANSHSNWVISENHDERRAHDRMNSIDRERDDVKSELRSLERREQDLDSEIDGLKRELRGLERQL